MNNEPKKKLGEIVTELRLRREWQDRSHSAHEQMEESLTDFDKELFACASREKHKYGKIFYIVVITKKEPLMEDVLRSYFFSRHTCPTPDWDQTVYKVHDEIIDYMWCIPHREQCIEFLLNPLAVVEEEKALLKHVLDFDDGTLFRLAKQLNGEELASPLLI